MSSQKFTLREHVHNMILASKEAKEKEEEDNGEHGHWVEYFIKVIGIAMNVFFVIGCYCFESPSNSVYAFGDWLFIIACIVHFIFSIYELFESVHHKNVMDPKDRDEVFEGVATVCANGLFAIGCVFFLPGVKYLSGFYYTASAIGAWFCILGSLGLVYSTFYAGMCFENEPGDSKLDPETHDRCRQLTKLNINATLIGTVLFVVGSFMYRPIFGGLCPPRSTDAVCEAVSSYGTKCYLYGSYLFLLASVLGLATTIIKDRSSSVDKSKPMAQKRRHSEPTETTKLMP